MENLVLCIIGLLFVLGLIDYWSGNKLKLGTCFYDGIKNMGPLAISMVGILSITPIVSDLIIKYMAPVVSKIGIDMSILTSSFIAIDMGAYRIAEITASSPNIIYFSGVLIASTLGCTLSFTLPLALGMIKKEHMSMFFKGILCGISTIPIGLFIGGILLDVPLMNIIINLLPIIVLSILLIMGMSFCINIVINIFMIIGKSVVLLGVLGLAIQGFSSITGFEVIENLLPIEESLAIVGKIAIFLGGAYIAIELIKRVLDKYLSNTNKVAGINSLSIATLIGSMASAIITFSEFDKLDDKGKVICTAFSVGGAYVFGGQLGYVAAEAKEVIGVYIVTKIICGILSILLSLWIMNKTKGRYVNG